MIDGWTLAECNCEHYPNCLCGKCGVVKEDRTKKVVSIDEHPSWTSDATGYRDVEIGTLNGYRTLDTRFLEAMEEIGLYGLEKYKEKSFDAQRQTGTLKRFDRTETREIQRHTSTHFAEYADNVPHDHFHTLRHQLAAAAFNAMMEYVYATEADGREL